MTAQVISASLRDLKSIEAAKSEDDKQACLRKFLNTREKKAETVISLDGQYIVRFTQKVAKKPQ